MSKTHANTLEELLGPVETKLTHDKTLNIYQRLLLCMRDLPYIQRDITKKINNQYTAVSHDQVTRGASDVFIKHGIYPRLKIIKEGLETVIVKKTKFDKSEYEVIEYMAVIQAIYELTNVDKPEEKVTINAFGQGQDGQDKAFGKAISYACKYALLKGLGIETGDDPDKEDNSRNQIIPPRNKIEAEETFILDGVILSKESFMGELVDVIHKLNHEEDLIDYEAFKDKNKMEINKFCKKYPEQSKRLKDLWEKKEPTLKKIGE